MPKAYWISSVEVSDAEAYKRYAEGAAPAIAKYKGEYLARGGKAQVMEGNGRNRNVVICFPDFDSATACYNSPEYQAARTNRVSAALFDCVIVEGVE